MLTVVVVVVVHFINLRDTMAMMVGQTYIVSAYIAQEISIKINLIHLNMWYIISKVCTMITLWYDDDDGDDRVYRKTRFIIFLLNIYKWIL